MTISKTTLIRIELFRYYDDHRWKTSVTFYRKNSEGEMEAISFPTKNADPFFEKHGIVQGKILLEGGNAYKLVSGAPKEIPGHNAMFRKLAESLHAYTCAVRRFDADVRAELLDPE